MVSNILKEVVVLGVMDSVEANNMVSNMIEMEGLESRVLEMLTIRKTKHEEEERRVRRMARNMARL